MQCYHNNSLHAMLGQRSLVESLSILCSLLDHSEVYDFHLQTLKKHVAFSVVHFDIN